MTTVKVIVHDGKFQADEVIGCALVRWVMRERLGHDVQLDIVRTRDQAVLAAAKSDPAIWVLDVGQCCDPALHNYDHHQPGGAGTDERGISYSSAGLVNHWELERSSDARIAKIGARLREVLLRGVDALDNGDEGPGSERGVRYLTVTGLLGLFNVCEQYSEAQLEAFRNAVDFSFHYVIEPLVADIEYWLDVRNMVERAFQNASGRYVVLDRDVPWREHLLELDRDKRILFTVYPNGHGRWMLEVVPVGVGSFVARKDLPEDWAGLEGRGLSEQTGITGGIFCHRKRFVSGWATKDAALAALELALVTD